MKKLKVSILLFISAILLISCKTNVSIDNVSETVIENNDFSTIESIEESNNLVANNMQYEVKIEDREVKNSESGNILRGTFYYPKDLHLSKKYPLIITSHELGATADMPWWQNYANHFANEGIAVFAFDYAGGGEKSRSDGLTTEMSVLTEASDLESVLNAVKDWPEIDKNKIILVGGSQGGGVASIVASNHVNELAGLILLYPAFYLPDDLHTKFPNINEIPEVHRRNNIIDVGTRYITDMYDYDYFANMSAFDKPVLIVHGDSDKTAPLEYSEKAVNIYKNAELHVIEGAGHVFTTEEYQKEFLQYVDEYLNKINIK